MAWAQWPGQSGISLPGVINSAPPVVNPAAAATAGSLVPGTQYSPEQWAQMQQQNWQQWAQWQQQYQQWHQQYGAEYQKSLNALNQQQTTSQQPPLPVTNTTVPPPLPHDQNKSKPPLPPEEPPSGASGIPNAYQNYTTAPPPSLDHSLSYHTQPPSYSTAPPVQSSSYSTHPQPSPDQNKSDRDGRDSWSQGSYQTKSWGANSNQTNQPPSLMSLTVQKPDNFNKRPFDQPLSQDPKRGRFDQGPGGNRWSQDGRPGSNWGDQRQQLQGRNQSQYPDRSPSNYQTNQERLGSHDRLTSQDRFGSQERLDPQDKFGTQDRLNQQDRLSQQDRQLPHDRPGSFGSLDHHGPQDRLGTQQDKPQPPPGNQNNAATLEELSESEKKFMKQFADWESQFNKWKDQNRNHPDKTQYIEYEKKWEAWRCQLLERREQMRKKRISLMNANQSEGDPQAPQPLNTTSTHQANSDPTKISPPADINKLTPNTNEPLEFNKLKEAKITNDDMCIDDEGGGGFLKTSFSEGIPGLDLVKEGEEGKETDNPEIILPDFEAISKGLNSILGDKNLLSMLSKVSQQQIPGINHSTDSIAKINIGNLTPMSNDSFHATSIDKPSGEFDSFEPQTHFQPRSEMVGNIDEQTRSSFGGHFDTSPNKSMLHGPGNFSQANFDRPPFGAAFSTGFNKDGPFGQRGPEPFGRGQNTPGSFGVDNFNRGPGAFNINKGPNDTFNRSGPNEVFNRSGRNELFNRSGPNDTFNRAGPNEPFNRGGPNDKFYRGGLNEQFNRGGLLQPGGPGFGKDLEPPGHEQVPKGKYTKQVDTIKDDDLDEDPFAYDREENEDSEFKEGNFGPAGQGGPNNFNRGPNDFNRGSSDFSRGPGDFNRGPGDFNRGSNDFNIGPSDFNRGPGGDFRRGPGGNFGRGPGENFNQGPGDNFIRGLMGPGGNFTRGPGGPGADFNRGPGGPGGDFNRGPGGPGGSGGNFNQRPGALSDDFNRNQGGPGGDFGRGRGGPGGDFNRGPRGPGGDFNKGPGGPGGDFNRGPNDFNRGPGGEFNRGQGGDFNRGFGRGSANFGPDGFGRRGNGPEDFNRDPEIYNQGGPNNFNTGGPDNFNRGGLDNFNRGPGSFSKGPGNFNRGPDEFNSRPNDNFERRSRGMGGNDNEEGAKTFGAEGGKDVGSQITENADIPVKEGELWKPEKIIDYDHKPMEKTELEVSIEPHQTFDYRHKPVNRIPYPDRPSWVAKILALFPEFNPNVGRFDRFPTQDRYDTWRNSRDPYSSHSRYNDRRYSESGDRRLDSDRRYESDRRYSDKNEDRRSSDRDRDKERRSDSRYEATDRDRYDRDRNVDRDRNTDRDRYSRDDKYSRFDRNDDHSRFEKEIRSNDWNEDEKDDRRFADDMDFDDDKPFEEDKRFGMEKRYSGGVMEKRDGGLRCMAPSSDIKPISRFDDEEKLKELEKSFNKPPPPKQSNITLVEDLLSPPGRFTRPARIVIILRGPPGSGKTFLAKLIKDKEVENGGSAPRILSLDDYFMVEQEKEVLEDGKKVKVKEMVYEYEHGMEASYRASLFRSFKKTITDGYFPFIIVDNINDKVKYFGEMWSFAKQNGFQVYICQLELDVQTCTKRNIHGRSEAEIGSCVKGWEPTPTHHPVLDATSLIQAGSIPEVEMEEINSPASDENDQESDEDNVAKSKWDTFDCSFDSLAKLDGISKPLRASKTMDEYLQLDDQWTPSASTKPGQKRVRWADLEERKEQEKMRAIGFVVGQTNWDRMMDPTMGGSALTQTKYIERVKKKSYY